MPLLKRNSRKMKWGLLSTSCWILIIYLQSIFPITTGNDFALPEYSRRLFRQAKCKQKDTDITCKHTVDKIDTEKCNDDLGMKDYSIYDFQITRSSWVPERSPSSARPGSRGWCPDVVDTKPWIMIDFVIPTSIEAITIWNLTLNTSTSASCSPFCLLYGASNSALSLYSNMSIATSMNGNKFNFEHSIKTRLIKLEFSSGQFIKNKCLGLEVHGCKIYGALSFNCTKEYKMFEMSEAVTTEKQGLKISASMTAQDCKTSCLNNSDCSIARFEETTCTHYPHSRHALWKSGDPGHGTTFVKLCGGAAVRLFPSINHASDIVTLNVENIAENAIITTIGYPFSFQSIHTTTWIVDYRNSSISKRFIRIVFTNISLVFLDNVCEDVLVISTALNSDTGGRRLDYRYNGRTFVVETAESLLVLTLRPCVNLIEGQVRKFRAVITGEMVPACLPKNMELFTGDKTSDGVCKLQEAYLTSQSVLNSMHQHGAERWEVTFKMQIIINIVYFYVVCPDGTDSDDDYSHFSISDGPMEYLYCNTDIPRETMYMTYTTVKVYFKQRSQEKAMAQREGFRLRYQAIKNKKRSTRFTEEKVCSEDFGKCYYTFQNEGTWYEAEELCRKCNLEMVTVASRSELDFIHHILRERLYTYDKFVLRKNEEYHISAHIGLFHNGRSFVWKSGIPVTYSAWSENHPVAGEDCTRTRFTVLTNQSWESEQCTIDKTPYFVCQLINQTALDKPCSCANGWKEHRNKCYLFYHIPLTWHEAIEHCKSVDSYIVEIDDIRERTFLAENGGHKHWVGLSNVVPGNYDRYSWATSGGRKRVMVRDLPDNYSSNYPAYEEVCVALQTKLNYRWELFECDYPLASICEGTPQANNPLCSDLAWKNPNVAKTFTESDCQDWTFLTTSAQKDFSNRFPGLSATVAANKFCWDPSDSGVLWCYTEDRAVLEICFVRMTAANEYLKLVEQINATAFTCEDGTVLSATVRCNGVFECTDFSDEILCQTKAHHMVGHTELLKDDVIHDIFENSTHFLCGSGEWIAIVAVCDEVIHCADASDETNCQFEEPNNSPCTNDNTCILNTCGVDVSFLISLDQFKVLDECTDGEFTCNTGTCIWETERCNGVSDCFDGSDEMQCESCENAIHCDGTICIPYKYQCDKCVDCADGSDEYFCEQEEPVTSCDQLWKMKLGGIISGYYIINGLRVFCDFSSMDEVIKVSIKHLDVNIDNKNIITSWMDGETLPIKDTEFEDAFYRKGYTCKLEVKSDCLFSYAIKDYKSVFTDCDCKLDIYDIVSPDFVSDNSLHNSTNSTVYRGGDGYRFILNDSNTCDEYNTGEVGQVNITENGDLHMLMEHMDWKIPVRVTTEISCISTQEVMSSDGESCKRCIYERNEERCGTSYLENCATFQCPKYTVKCENSFCIPLHFVCNNKEECPYGTDEVDCTCSKTTKEVYILLDDETSASTEISDAAVHLARQFYSKYSIIRILYLSLTSAPETFNTNELLFDIREKIYNPLQTEIDNSECRYNVMAKNFLGGVNFRYKGPKGVIYLQNGSSEIGNLLFGDILGPSCSLYRVLVDPNFRLINKYSSSYKFVEDVRIRRWGELSAFGYRRFKQICKDETFLPCQGGYRCSSSKQCLPLKQVCDKEAQCVNGEDEQFCDIKCPTRCSCSGQSVNCRATQLTYSTVSVIYRRTKRADFSMNSNMSNVLLDSDNRLIFPVMTSLNLSRCMIRQVKSEAFQFLTNLQCLDISHNHIELLVNDEFRFLKHLRYLILDGNSYLHTISPTIFNGLFNLRRLNITGTQIKRIYSNMFNGMTLSSIDIRKNKIEEIEDYAFNNTIVDEIDFRDNDIEQFNKHIFDGISSLKTLRATAFKFCCVRPCSTAENDCYPPRDEFSSCEDLIRHPVLQAVLWLVGLTALLGNTFSILYRVVYDRKRLKIGYGIFVTNLAGADLLMGVYLLTIAIADSYYRNRYIFEDDKWRNSILCVSAGVFSAVSSEASIFFVCLITFDRLLVIKYPFGTFRITEKMAHICCIVCWAFALVLATIPVVFKGVFKNEFYSKSGVCIALPLTKDKSTGWLYSVSVYIGLNFFAVMLVGIGQALIFLEIRKATKVVKKMHHTSKRDHRVARNLLLIATTDFMCWFPIGVIGMLALSGYPISGDVYAWTAVFVLPMNSALNPVLYTLSSISGKESFNLSTEEQEKIYIDKEIGRGLLRYDQFLHSMGLKKQRSTYKSLYDLLLRDESVSLTTIVTLVEYLSRYMSTVHDKWAGIDDIILERIYIKKNKYKNVANVVLDSKLSLSDDGKALQENMLQFGNILKRLVIHYRKQM